MTADRPAGSGPRERADREHGVWLAVPLGLLAAASAYLATYLLLGDAWRPGPGPGPHPIRMRVFPNEPVAVLFAPAAALESRLRGYEIESATERELLLSSP